MFTKIFLRMLAICLFAGSAAANTVIEYALDDGWTYEEGYSGTLLLAENPAGGITAAIDVPTGIEDGGLLASKHDLPGFSLADNGFLQLEYSSLFSTITPGSTAGLNLCLELEFYDTSNYQYEMAIAIWLDDGGTTFETWFESAVGGDYFYEEAAPDGLAITEGVLGLYSNGSHVLPYFQDGGGSVLCPFAAWDISGIAGAHTYSVDNDFEAYTLDGGTVSGSVNLERVVYGPGSVTCIPAPASIILLASGLVGLVRLRSRIDER